MIRALLAGTKTQTRRVVTPQPEFAQVHVWKGETIRDAESRAWCWKQHDFGDGDPINATPGSEMVAALCPYGGVGDRLWVRETWCAPDVTQRAVVYRSDLNAEQLKEELLARCDMGGAVYAPWRPSIFMPRWASRITLELTAVRLESLQNISDDDARAEGCSGHDPEPAAEGGTLYTWKGRSSASSPRAHYAALWDSLNGERPGCAWSDNPMLWVLSFRRVELAATAVNS